MSCLRFCVLFLFTSLCACFPPAPSSGPPSQAQVQEEPQAGDDDDAVDDDDATDDVISDDDDATEPEPPEPEKGPTWTLVSQPASAPLLGSTHVEVADDGSIYVVWVADSGDDKDAWVARSLDGGSTWTEPVLVDGPDVDPLVGWANQPFLLIAEDAVHVVTMVSDPMQVLLYSSPRDGELDFGDPLEVGADAPANYHPSYARAVLAPDGEIWVGYNAAIQHSQWNWDHEMAFARESTGFAHQSVENGDPPCDCCPTTLMVTSTGDMLLGYRSQTEVGREVMVAVRTADSDNFEASHAVSAEPWDEEVCPNQGPWLAELSDGMLLLATADASQGDQLAWISRSADGGQSWGPETPMSPVTSLPRRPTIGVDPSDRVWGVYQTSVFDSVLVTSDDAALTFSEEQELVAPTGSLASAVLSVGPGGTAVVGITPDDGVWLFQP